MNIEYDVDKDGMVVKIKQVKGPEYNIQTHPPVKSWPAPSKDDRWSAFKRMVAKQEPNVIIPYGGFPNKDELRRARNLFAHQDSDRFFLAALNGSVLLTKSDIPNLTLYVKRQVKEDEAEADK